MPTVFHMLGRISASPDFVITDVSFSPAHIYDDDYFTAYVGKDFPYISLSADIDITELVSFCKRADGAEDVLFVWSL